VYACQCSAKLRDVDKRKAASVFFSLVCTSECVFPFAFGATDFVPNLYQTYGIFGVLRRLQLEVADLKLPSRTAKRHYHMFATFAVEVLLAGVPIDQVSILLGHSSVRGTEKH